MRAAFGLLGLLIVAVIGLMLKTKQLDGLKTAGIPGVPGKTVSDLDPRKIVESYKNTVANVDVRNQALLKGELPDSNFSPERLKAIADSADAKVRAAEAVAGDSAPGGKPAPTMAATVAPTPNAPSQERPSRMFRYGMDMRRLSAGEVQPYIGRWGFYTASPERRIELNLQPDRSISSASVQVPPAAAINKGDNFTMLWRNVQTGHVFVTLTDNEYIHLDGEAPHIKATLYKRGADGTTFLRVLEFPLARR